MEAVQSREERATSCLESDIHPLISGWVHGDTANLKVKVLPPPTLAPALALPAPFQNPPLLGREKLESAPAIPPLLLRRGPEAGGSTFPWYLLPLPTAGQMWSHWTTLSLEAAQSRLLGVPALGNSAPGGKWILGLEKIDPNVRSGLGQARQAPDLTPEDERGASLRRSQKLQDRPLSLPNLSAPRPRAGAPGWGRTPSGWCLE